MFVGNAASRRPHAQCHHQKEYSRNPHLCGNLCHICYWEGEKDFVCRPCHDGFSLHSKPEINQHNVHTYIYIHSNIHSFIHSFIHIYICIFIHSCMHACMHACIHTYIHTYIRTYMNTHTHSRFEGVEYRSVSFVFYLCIYCIYL